MDKTLRLVRIYLLISAIQRVLRLFSGKLFYKSNRKLFSCVCIAWYKHSKRWENSRQLCKPSTSSRVCITVSNSPNRGVFISGYANTENVFYCLNMYTQKGVRSKGRIFCDRQVYKFLPINLGACKPIFYFLLIHHIWGERVLWGAVFIIQTSYKMQYFTIFQDKFYSFNITSGLLISETAQKISKITYTASLF